MSFEKLLNKKTVTLLIFDIAIINLSYLFALIFRFDASITNIPLEYLKNFENYKLSLNFHHICQLFSLIERGQIL